MSLKQDLEREIKLPVSVKMGRPGALNVYVDGQQIYSYQRSGQYPDLQQLVTDIRNRQ